MPRPKPVKVSIYLGIYSQDKRITDLMKIYDIFKTCRSSYVSVVFDFLHVCVDRGEYDIIMKDLAKEFPDVVNAAA